MTEFHLTSFFCVPMKKKKKWLKVSPFAKHYDYLTEYGGSRYLQYAQKVMSWKEVNTAHAKQSF